MKEEEKLSEEEVKKIENFLMKYKISGIIQIPRWGAFSMFFNSTDRLIVLEHAKDELLYDDKMRELKCMTQIEVRKNTLLPSKEIKNKVGYIN